MKYKINHVKVDRISQACHAIFVRPVVKGIRCGYPAEGDRRRKSRGSQRVSCLPPGRSAEFGGIESTIRRLESCQSKEQPSPLVPSALAFTKKQTVRQTHHCDREFC